MTNFNEREKNWIKQVKEEFYVRKIGEHAWCRSNKHECAKIAHLVTKLHSCICIRILEERDEKFKMKLLWKMEWLPNDKVTCWIGSNYTHFHKF